MYKYLILCLFFTSCASKQAGEMLGTAQKGYQAFQTDYINFSKSSLEREWILREALRKEALRVEVAETTFTAAQAAALVEKYVNVYQENVISIEKLKNENFKSLQNAKISDDLIKAVLEYHKTGLQTEEVNQFLLNQVMPTLTEIILKGKK